MLEPLNLPVLRLVFILGVASAISNEYGYEDAEKMALLGDRISKNPHCLLTDEDEQLVRSAIECYNQMGYILGLTKLY